MTTYEAALKVLLTFTWIALLTIFFVKVTKIIDILVPICIMK